MLLSLPQLLPAMGKQHSWLRYWENLHLCNLMMSIYSEQISWHLPGARKMEREAKGGRRSGLHTLLLAVSGLKLASAEGGHWPSRSCHTANQQDGTRHEKTQTFQCKYLFFKGYVYVTPGLFPVFPVCFFFFFCILKSIVLPFLQKSLRFLRIQRDGLSKK